MFPLWICTLCKEWLQFKASDVIPSGAYVSPNGNTVSSVNELHAEAKNLIRQKHGISTRHLQGYLDWFVFKKKLKYTLDMRKWKLEAYMELMMEQIPFICRDIVKLPLPIDFYSVYGGYHYGIFKNQLNSNNRNTQIADVL